MCLGPQGSLSLVLPCSVGGASAVTGCGSSIMRACLSRGLEGDDYGWRQHPAAALFVSTAESLSVVAGCGGSSMAVMLAGAVDEIGCICKDSRALIRVMHAAQREGRRIVHDVLLPVVEEMCLSAGEDEVRMAAAAVAATAMAGKLSQRYAPPATLPWFLTVHKTRVHDSVCLLSWIAFQSSQHYCPSITDSVVLCEQMSSPLHA